MPADEATRDAITSYHVLPESIDLLDAMALGAAIGAGLGGGVGVVLKREADEWTGRGAFVGLLFGAAWVGLGSLGLY